MADKIIVLITGANRGIGFELAKNLITRPPPASYHILLGARDLSKAVIAAESLLAIPGITGTATPLQLDVTSDSSVDAAASTVSAAHGRVDVLVNNAGVIVTSTAETPARDAARRVFATNVIGAISVADAFLPLLRASAAQGHTPRLIFVTSSTGSLTLASDPSSRYRRPEALEYRAGNAARNMVMIQYWTRLEGEGVLVFGGDPGLVATDFFDQEAVRKRGAAEPDVGGERIARIVRGERDTCAGKVCTDVGTCPW